MGKLDEKMRLRKQIRSRRSTPTSKQRLSCIAAYWCRTWEERTAREDEASAVKLQLGVKFGKIEKLVKDETSACKVWSGVELKEIEGLVESKAEAIKLHLGVELEGPTARREQSISRKLLSWKLNQDINDSMWARCKIDTAGQAVSAEFTTWAREGEQLTQNVKAGTESCQTSWQQSTSR